MTSARYKEANASRQITGYLPTKSDRQSEKQHSRNGYNHDDDNHLQAIHALKFSGRKSGKELLISITMRALDCEKRDTNI